MFGQLFLKNILEEYYFRPAGIVPYSSGGFGGVKAAIHLRAFLTAMEMPTISSPGKRNPILNQDL